MKYNNFQQIPERMKAYYTIDVTWKGLKFHIDSYIKKDKIEVPKRKKRQSKI